MTRVVIIESPYFGVPDACRYLACCGLDCIERGEVPLASHSFLPLCLPEHVVVDGTGRTGREIGIEAWKAVEKLEETVLCKCLMCQPGESIRVPLQRFWYVDLGMSHGMADSYRLAFPQSATLPPDRSWIEGDKRVRTLQGRASEIWWAGEWPSMARLTPNHEVGK